MSAQGVPFQVAMGSLLILPLPAPGIKTFTPNAAISPTGDPLDEDEFRLVFSTTGALDFENVALRLEPVDAPPAPPAPYHPSYPVDVGSLRDICRVHRISPGRSQLATQASRELSMVAPAAL